MSKPILDTIFAAKKLRVAAAKVVIDPQTMIEKAMERRMMAQRARLRAALSRDERTNIIAEIKKASPSKGVINGSADAASVARKYSAGGAAAISVLTEEDFFGGSLEDLRAVRSVVDLPILRKDFIFEPFQIYEAAAAGADAILLIAAMLDDETINKLKSVAEDELGLDALIEVHTRQELERVIRLGAGLIGVNNRDLKTFAVSLDISRQLIALKQPGTLMISESGITSRSEIAELRSLGFDGFLIGETLMRVDDPEKGLQGLI